jgi:hypothetical protein
MREVGKCQKVDAIKTYTPEGEIRMEYRPFQRDVLTDEGEPIEPMRASILNDKFNEEDGQEKTLKDHG